MVNFEWNFCQSLSLTFDSACNLTSALPGQEADIGPAVNNYWGGPRRRTLSDSLKYIPT